uniref:Uncharacterized protein n=1 Tax=Anoplophora glabripennis TaxID=217634 RepID=V5H2T8_ANOGL
MYNISNLICYILLLATFSSARENLHSNVTSNTSSQIAEGGALPQHSEDKTHLRREHVTILEKTTATKVNDTLTAKDLNGQSTVGTSNKTGSKDNEVGKPVIEKPELDASVSKKIDVKQNVKKGEGVNFNDTDSSKYVPSKETTSVNSTTKPVSVTTKPTTKATIPKKPLFVEPNELASKTAETKNPEPDPKIPNIDTLLEKKSNRANYVIPIVAVILSVPLVAIIMSVLYKRGQDWWQHRNYRRMDFLIEGMYNN